MCITESKGHRGRLALPPVELQLKRDWTEESIGSNVKRKVSDARPEMLALPPMREVVHPQKEQREHPIRRWSHRKVSDAHHAEKPHRYVEHHYHDHAMDKCDDHHDEPLGRGGVMVAFPTKLHEILDHIEEDGLAHVISWQPHGRCFVVRKPEEFVDHIMPLYFRQNKYASFQRQLNLYGFQRITRGADKGGYYHELFLRGKPSLAHHIHRCRIKGTGVRPRSNPDEEPDFYAMPSVEEDDTPTPRPEKITEKPEKTKSSSLVLSRATSTDADDLKRVRSALFNMETMNSSNVIPFETTSCLLSELERSRHEDDDEVVIFEGKPFHYLDPYKDAIERLPPLAPRVATPCPDQQNGPSLFTDAQMEALLTQMTRPGGICSDVENMDDREFGTLLERIVQP